ncbi:MAG TPA: helix-turn-helix transcriptional regulator [Tepidisphaeraceae bacterium]|jgi:transcriptional regulator with XRE-family HTH domain
MVATKARPVTFRLMGIDYGKIRALRDKLGLSQKQAAERAGLNTAQAWNNYECGRREPRIAVLEKIATALGVKARDLLK